MNAAVTVRTTGPQGYACTVEARTHLGRADEPAEAGGTDTGSTPMEHLLGALGACTAVTLRMYAGRKGWPLEGVEVRLTHGRAAEGQEGPADRIHRDIVLTGPLDGEQRARLMDIAGKCPVHKLLSAGAAITSAEVA